MVNTYRDALHCEALRAAVFEGDRDPLLLGEPAEWVALLLEALRLAARGRPQESQGLRERAFESAPASPGRIDGEPFDWIADGDGRLGPILEAIVNGRYYWVPFSQIRSLSLEEPTDLRDLVWAPGRLELINGGETVALIPARYPGSESSADPRLRLARLTEWVDRGGGLFAGLGQRMLVTDSGEYPLLSTRLVGFEPPAASGS
jgi:type VI secretion system protein ImpE